MTAPQAAAIQKPVGPQALSAAYRRRACSLAPRVQPSIRYRAPAGQRKAPPAAPVAKLALAVAASEAATTVLRVKSTTKNLRKR